MSRISIGTYLSKAKRSLEQSLQTNGEHPLSIVIGNESADLDSISCALVYGYIQSNKPEYRKQEKYTIPMTNLPRSELRLRPELKALLKHADLESSHLVTLDDLGKVEDLHNVLPPDSTDWTLVDHNVLQGEIGKQYQQRVSGATDHHEDEGKVRQDAKPRLIEKTGSCNSHVVNYCQKTWDELSLVRSNSDMSQKDEDDSTAVATWDAQLAKLALGSILIDTVNMTADSKVTDHDRKAVEYLESKIKASDELGSKFQRDSFFKEINDAKSDLHELTLEEVLRKDYKQWTESGLYLGISSSVRSISYLQSKCERVEDFVPALIAFAKDRNLHLYAVMTAHNENDAFERQLLLVTNKHGKAVEVCDQFMNACSDELQLEVSKTKIDRSEAVWMRLWEQKNLAASRKKVGPLLREAMG